MSWDYVLEFGGGLGDVLYQLYERGAYNLLNQLEPGQRARVILVCHNPHVAELFEWHPKREQLDIEYVGYWHVSQDTEMRAKLGLPPRYANAMLPTLPEVVQFYPRPGDPQPKGAYTVVAASAGMPHRSFSPELVERLVHDWFERTDEHLVFVGRTFERDGRTEVPPPAHPRVVNLIDQQAVPTTCETVRQAHRLITCHSALNLLGWRCRVPQLLLYPQAVLDHHWNGTPDQWLFGVNYPETVHALFENYTPHLLDRLLHV